MLGLETRIQTNGIGRQDQEIHHGGGTYNETWLEHIKLQHDVSTTNLKLADLEWEEDTISTQLL